MPRDTQDNNSEEIAGRIETAPPDNAWNFIRKYRLGPFSPPIRRAAPVIIPETACGAALAHGLSVIARRFREPYTICGIPTPEELTTRLFALAINPSQREDIERTKFDLDIVSSRTSPPPCDMTDETASNTAANSGGNPEARLQHTAYHYQEAFSFEQPA